MASRSTSVSRAHAVVVHLACHQCSTQLGIFENEWIRLTSSYARARNSGRHVNTEIGNRIQHVPAGVTQKAIEGCGMAEIFCKQCSNLVGQYCKSAPEASKQNMVDQHFYRLSRTFLSDPQTNEKVEPVFGYEGDIGMAPPEQRGSTRPSVKPRMSVARLHRSSIAPTPAAYTPVAQTPRDSLGMFADVGIDLGRQERRSSAADISDDSIVAERLSGLERRVSVYEAESFRQSRSGTPILLHGYQSPFSVAERSSSQQSNGQDIIISDQQKQIAALTSQVETLNGTIQDLRGLIQDLRDDKKAARDAEAAKGLLLPNIPTNGDFKDNFQAMVAAMANSREHQGEMKRVQEENEQLKARFAVIEKAMGLMPGSASGIDIGKDQAASARQEEAALVMSSTKDIVSRATSGSEVHLPTPAGSQQTRFASQYPQPSAPTYPIGSDLGVIETMANTVIPRDLSEQVTQDDDKADKMHIEEDSAPIMDDEDGDEEVDQPEPESCLAGGNEPDVTEETSPMEEEVSLRQEEGDTGVESPAHSSAQPSPDLETTKSKLTSTNNLSKKQEIKAAPLPINEPMFGVIKPVKPGKPPRKSRRKTQPPPEPAEMEPELPVVIPFAKRADPEVVEFSDDEEASLQPQQVTISEQTVTTPMQLHHGRARRGPPVAPGVSPWVHVTTVQVPQSSPLLSGVPTMTDLPLFQPGLPVFQPSVQSRPDSVETDGEDLQIDITRPEDVRAQLERELNGEKEPKEPKEKVPVIQTTERLLNEELMELGMEEWIGKDKSSKEYRELIDKARTERRERKKHEALAKAGIVVPGVTLPPAPVPAAHQGKESATTGRGPRKYKTLTALRRNQNRNGKSTKPLTDVTNQQNAQTPAKTTRKRKANIIAQDENVTPESKEQETVSKKARGPGRLPSKSSARKSGFWPEPELVPDEVEAGVKTRRQMKAAEIEKLDKLAQEAMETEQAT